MADSVDAIKYFIDSTTFPQVIIIDVAMPHIFTKQQFETAFNCIKNHQKQILTKFGWISTVEDSACWDGTNIKIAGTFQCKGLIETYEPVNKQGKHFIRYTAVRE